MTCLLGDNSPRLYTPQRPEELEGTWRSLPKAGGVYQWCNGAKVRIGTSRAIRVNFRVNILEITSIDQMQEQFTAVFAIQLFYIDPMLRDFLTDVYYETDDGLQVEKNCKLLTTWKYSGCGRIRILCEDGTRKELEPTSVQHMRQPRWDTDDTLFKPSFSFGNAVGNADVIQHVRMLEYCTAAGGHVFEKYKYQVTFAERLELNHLPFDKQMLRMRIYGEDPIWRMQLAPFTDGSAGGLRGGSAVPTEWLLDKAVRVCGRDVPPARVMVWKLSDSSFRSVVDVVVHVKRVPSFYLMNVVVVFFFITLLTVAAYACKPDDFNGRATIQFTLFLTTVGYKIVTNSWTPVKSYLTLLDKYILLNFAAQTISIVQSYGVIQLACSRVRDDDADWENGIYTGSYTGREPPDHECWGQLGSFERWFAMALYGLWMIAHAVFYLIWRFELTEKFFISWDDVYKENGMHGEIIDVYDEHAYTFRPLLDEEDEEVEVKHARH